MSGKINVTFTKPEKAQLHVLGKASDHGSAASLIAAIVREKLGDELPNAEPEPYFYGPDVTIRTRVSAIEKHEFRERCQLEKVSESVLLRRHVRIILKQIPFFCGDEIIALSDTNRQLTAIGRNLNQVAKRINSRPDESAEALVSTRLLRDIDAHLETLRTDVESLIKRSRLRVIG